jgi:hypothetical protein
MANAAAASVVTSFVSVMLLLAGIRLVVERAQKPYIARF